MAHNWSEEETTEIRKGFGKSISAEDWLILRVLGINNVQEAIQILKDSDTDDWDTNA